ncbi:hypothetical protein [Photobacterium sp. 1_MG-2023]|uniref:hypothetical protein n=1 Tax=Photobacterium sp. 1_MG-2023 TaxID=3062646 RepID=UPI0026E3E9C4|nr:hypothetical protein [Photobacterium sp. 1_MG-2023]MDO6707238.1 hypothetical protein [Photobacterium sp. 1_MG-2023]
MNTYHIYIKGECVTLVDVNAPTFREEEKQLFEQGFELDFRGMKANNTREALEKYHLEDEFNPHECATLAVIDALTMPIQTSRD